MHSRERRLDGWAMPPHDDGVTMPVRLVPRATPVDARENGFRLPDSALMSHWDVHAFE